MKIRRERNFQKAAKIFTDREEPRAAFWKQYDTTKSEMYQEDCDIHVLNYYGIGGIGKSRLIQEIMLEMDTKLKSPRYIYIDFYNCQERCDVLHRMKNQLIDRYKFNFPLFELGHYVYAKKVGENIENIEVEQLTRKSPVLSLVLSLAGNIPLVGTAAKILDIVTQAAPIADSAISIILTKIKKHGKKLRQLDEMREDELYNHLPYLFAVDLKDNLEKKAKEPLVVFLTHMKCWSTN